jgi:hypothetical protein
LVGQLAHTHAKAPHIHTEEWEMLEENTGSWRKGGEKRMNGKSQRCPIGFVKTPYDLKSHKLQEPSPVCVDVTANHFRCHPQWGSDHSISGRKREVNRKFTEIYD